VGARNIVIGCSDERLKEVNEKFVRKLGPDFSYFRNGGLLFSVPNFSKIAAVNFFEGILKPNDCIRIWALMHENCEFIQK